MHLFDLFPPAHIAVAVSGGADSMCLALLAQKWCAHHNITLTALTVDHGLRKESAQEAKSVAAQLKAVGIQHKILRWKGEKPTARIEEKAREARYQLLCDFCRRKKIPILLLAHHQQDNIETFFLRLCKASGLTGLGGMHPIKRRNGILLMRPLLQAEKSDIITYLTRHKMQWVEDPMNQNPAFERVHWRQQMPLLEKMGLKTAYLTKTMKRLRRAENALNQMTDSVLNKIYPDDRGFIPIPLDLFNQQPEEIQLRLLLRLIPLVGGKESPLSFDRVESIISEKPQRTTIGNCCLVRQKNTLFITKEAARMPAPLPIPAKKWIQWDRFQIYSSTAGTIQRQTQKDKNCSLPLLIQQTFPVFTDKKGLEICPDLDYKTKKSHINVIIRFSPPNKG